jgi:hypothetical protein
LKNVKEGFLATWIKFTPRARGRFAPARKADGIGFPCVDGRFLATHRKNQIGASGAARTPALPSGEKSSRFGNKRQRARVSLFDWLGDEERKNGAA